VNLPMRLPLSLFVLTAAAIVATWWWLGAPARMPPAPLAANEKLYCVSYSPFRGAQSPLEPGIQIDPRQIEDDMVRLSRLTECVRTYSTRNGLNRVPEIAERYGVKVIQGIWLGGDRAAQERDIATAVGIAQRYNQVIRSVVVGNEVLLRGEMTPGELAATIRRVKAQVAQPVTYADVWEFWLRYREVYAAVDFVTIHILPYWEDFPIPARNAAAHVEDIRRKVAAAFPDKEILLGETGWPSAGRMREGALPSPANQARVLHDVLATAKREGYHANLIEAFDQPWKRRLEGTVGGHWGLLDAQRREPKFHWGMPVSNHPRWRLQAAEGVALAALVFAAAFGARRRDEPLAAIAPPIWFAVAAMALGPGILVGWTIKNVPVESLTAGDWLRSLTMAGLAVAAPLIGAAALVRTERVPAFARILGPASLRARGHLSLALGLALILLCAIAVQVALGLVFDPRYKDFPFAPLTAAVIPYLVLVLVGPWARKPEDRKAVGSRGMAETMLAALLGGAAVYIVLSEGFANWQAVWLAAVFLTLATVLWRLWDVQNSG
jgi:exo-beta-1,3-glucanase (GH17 family)